MRRRQVFSYPDLNCGVVAVRLNHVVVLLRVATSEISILIPSNTRGVSKQARIKADSRLLNCGLTST